MGGAYKCPEEESENTCVFHSSISRIICSTHRSDRRSMLYLEENVPIYFIDWTVAVSILGGVRTTSELPRMTNETYNNEIDWNVLFYLFK